MTSRTELDAYLGELFGEKLLEEARSKDPENANGLQIEGNERIEKMGLGVS